MGKVCSLRSYAVLTKVPLRGCNVLRIEFNIMAAVFLAIPPFPHFCEYCANLFGAEQGAYRGG